MIEIKDMRDFRPAQRTGLLTRDEFRAAVFARDGHRCVLCRMPSSDTDPWGKKLDAHHIIERRLFPDGGYYLDNGATVCEPCHLKAEQTLISCEDLRAKCGITTTVLPPHLYRDQRYDKWGNPILDNGMRLRGELFDDESVQKVLAPVLHEFTTHVKYPRTYHLPWSPGASDDDRIMDDPDANFGGREIVVTEKMDGENTTMYRDYIHARSLEYAPHASRSRVKAMWSEVAHDIPEGWRVCGENLYAEHSIHYDDLESYFLVFSVWNEKNVCLSWDETVEWAGLLGFQTVSSIARFTWQPEFTYREGSRVGTVTPQQFMNYQWDQASIYADRLSEGYVVRLADSFHYKDFRRSVAKYVRANHVQHRDGHWSNRRVVPNGLKR